MSFAARTRVFDACAAAVAGLQQGGVAVLVCQQGLEAVAVEVGKRKLRAGVGPLTPADHPAAFRPARDVHAEFTHPRPVALLTVLAYRLLPP